MNSTTSNRELIAHGLIIAAVVIGGWIMFAQPKAQELADLETAIATTRASDVPLTQSGIEVLARRVEQVRDRISDVKRRNELARDSSNLYSEVMALGSKHGVLIERLRSGAESRTVAGGKATAIRMDVTIRGDYESMARFLDDVISLPGFMRPVSLSVNPAQGDGREVAARMVCEALSFELPEQFALMDSEDGHAEP